jgi:hypothetical protein
MDESRMFECACCRWRCNRDLSNFNSDRWIGCWCGRQRGPRHDNRRRGWRFFSDERLDHVRGLAAFDDPCIRRQLDARIIDKRSCGYARDEHSNGGF